jgi:3-phenylpropionate/trans-cinnamate dioxygenase ferredoxin reductase component
MSSDQTFAIVGASLAGARAAETLRQAGFDGRVLLLGAEGERPYERPPLSKEYVRGDFPREKVYIHTAEFYAEHGIELRTSTPVQTIDTAARELVLHSGERVGFDRLLLTTGAEPRRLHLPGSDLDGVLYLRELQDADAIAERIARGGKLVVIGGGWIGAELAASAREKGLEVTIIQRSSLPLERVLGAELGAIYRDLHLERGVELRSPTALEALEGDGAVERVRTADGSTIDCDFLVVGIGAAPRTALAQAPGIEIDNGILVNDRLETQIPGIFAAGDVANAWHPFYGRRIRVEHWANALHQGPAAARGMLGQSVSYDRLPYFYSDQYDLGMEYSGYATHWDEVVFRGDPAKHEFIAFWLEAGRVVAGMNVNVWGVTDAIQALIRSRKPVDPARLRDTDVALEDLAVSQRVTVAKRFAGGGN